MSKPFLLGATIALALFAANAMAQVPALDVRKEMTDGVEPAALAVWDFTNTATNDEGALDPARLTADDWAKLKQSAQLLEMHAERMAAAENILIKGPPVDADEAPLPDGVASNEDIQARIKSEPDGFRTLSADMAAHARALIAAADSRDLNQADKLAVGLYDICQACHNRYYLLSE